jgi:uncharacterized alpha-E superfamily protein
MLGRVANGIFWMYRYLERAENTARLLAAGHRMSLTRGQDAASEEWRSVLTTLGLLRGYNAAHEGFNGAQVCDFVLRGKTNELNVLSMFERARFNARTCRSAITLEVWEAVNEAWMTLREMLARPVRDASLGAVLAAIRRESTLTRGATHGSMMRNEIYCFARAGTFLERADNTARILDVKFHLLLPTNERVGGPLDYFQWAAILRSVSALTAYHWVYKESVKPWLIADLLMLKDEMPRSLASCYGNLVQNLDYIAQAYGRQGPAQRQARAVRTKLQNSRMDDIFQKGLHEFIGEFISSNNRLGAAITEQYLM